MCYDSVKFGKNVVKQKRKVARHGDLFWWSCFKLEQTQSRFIMITIDLDEITDEINNGNIFLMDGTSRSNWNDGSDNKYSPSGKILLMLTKSCHPQPHIGIAWGEKHASFIKEIKSNTAVGAFQHNASRGNYYSFGNKGNFALIDDSSVSQYAIKKSNLITKELNNAVIEDLAANEMMIGIRSLELVIPSIRLSISPVIDTAFGMQDVCGSINLKETPSSEYGIWKTSISVNAYTEKLHYENDCTYMLTPF